MLHLIQQRWAQHVGAHVRPKIQQLEMYEKPNLEGQNLVVMDGQGTIFLIPMLLVVLKNPSHLDTPLAQPFVTNESLFGVLAYIEKTNEGLLKYKMSY